jgi:pilus assembly protein FimV
MNLRNNAILLLVCFGFAMCHAFAADIELKGPKNATAQYSGVVYGPITSSDTLWQIASRYRQNKSLSIYQVMYAIFELNPEAFEQENLNLIKDGSVLKLPSEKYIARIDKEAARLRAEEDAMRLEARNTAVQGNGATSVAKVPSAGSVSKSDLDQTKEQIEQRLGALDEAQSRQFLAIRQQFAESIDSVQAILDENQKLFERLERVNNDITELRSNEELKAEQMQVMGQSIEELLAKSREEEQRKEQLAAIENSSWLDDPLTLIALTSALSLSILGGIAAFLLRRKQGAEAKNVHEVADDDIVLESHNSALDDLSDALSDELSGEIDDGDEDDDLFAGDDLLDDVLSDELRESLDEALDDTLDDSLDAELDEFDDLGDEILENDPVIEEFEAGSAQVGQDELDSLFDEDDDLLAEISPEITDTPASKQEKEAATTTDDTLDTEEDIVDDDIDELLAAADASETEDDEPGAETAADPLLGKVADEEDQPEISIDELFDNPVAKAMPGLEQDNGEEISQEMLQHLDKEIAAQNAELDNITGTLLDELEQVEQMRGMMVDEEDPVIVDKPVKAPKQPSIQKLDDAALSEGFEEKEAFEPDFLDVLDDGMFEKDEILDDDVVSSENAQPEPEPEKTAQITEDSEVENKEGLATNAEPESSPDETEISASDMHEGEAALTEDSIRQSERTTDDKAEDALEETAQLEDDSEPEIENNEGLSASAEPASSPDNTVDSASDMHKSEAELTDDEVKDALEETLRVTDDEQAELDGDEFREIVDEEPVGEHEEPLAKDESPQVDEQTLEGAAQSEGAVDNDATDLDDEDSEEQADAAQETQPLSVDEALAQHAGDEPDSAPDEKNEQDSTEQNDDPGLDEDQLEKALEDFEHQDLDALLQELTAENSDDPLDNLDELDFGSVAENFVQKKDKKLSRKTPEDNEEQTDLGSLSDADLDATTFDEDSLDDDLDDLDDLPGLGDWLNESSKSKQKSDDESLLEELEEANFDELLDALGNEVDDEDSDADSTLDVNALLQEPDETQTITADDLLSSDDDFLDVEALLDASLEDESEPMASKDLNLSAPLADYFGDIQQGAMVDVDGDDGFGAKLDLAQAYIEIGEHESATELLEDIIKNGSKEQKEEAEKVLNSLS